MPLSIRCGICRNDYKLGTKKCKNCGNNITKNHKYKAACKLPSGKWKSKIVDMLTLARKVEAKFIVETVEEAANDPFLLRSETASI